jgi:hypothetical protein
MIKSTTTKDDSGRAQKEHSRGPGFNPPKKMRRGFGLGLICQLTKDITAFGFTPCPLTLWETVELG